MKWWIYLIFVLVFNFRLSAQGKVFATDEGAIRGYDPVAYHLELKPVKGVTEFSHSWHDATWYFKSKENRDLFIRNPEKYAPQFGGYCAYGTSRNYKAKTEPDAWTVYQGKLYLNYDLDVLKIWTADKEGYIKKALANWPNLEDQ